jgi:hypothetical protein
MIRGVAILQRCILRQNKAISKYLDSSFSFRISNRTWVDILKITLKLKLVCTGYNKRIYYHESILTTPIKDDSNYDTFYVTKKWNEL